MVKVIMELNGREFESAHDWDSLDDFFAACDAGEVDEDEFGPEPDYSAGGSCHYRLAEDGVAPGRVSYDAFRHHIMTGESRNRPGVGVGYILLDGFYAEWAYGDIETDEDGEVTPAGWAEVERIDAEQAPLAYAAYLAGEAEYIA